MVKKNEDRKRMAKSLTASSSPCRNKGRNAVTGVGQPHKGLPMLCCDAEFPP